MGEQLSDSLKIDRDFGHIELGVVDQRSLEIVSASKQFFAWIGRSALSRLSISDIVPDLTTQKLRETLKQNRGVCEFEVHCTSANKKSVVLRIRLIQTGKSEISPLRMIAFDISEIQRKEDILRTVSGYLEAHKNIIAESRKTLKALLDSLPLAVFMLDRELNITSETSRKALELFGDDFCKRSFVDLTGFSSTEREPLELAFSGVPWNLMEPVLPKEFRRGNRVFSLKFVPVFEDHKLGAVTVMVDDITEQRHLEISLKQTDADNRALVAILASKNEFFDLVTLAHRAADVSDCLSDIRPIIHSLKGGFSVLECESFAHKCHLIEEELNPILYTPELGRKLSEELLEEISNFMGRYGEILRVGGVADRELNRPTVAVDYEAIGDFFRKAKQEGAASNLLSAIESLAEVPVSSLLSWLDKAWSKTLLHEGKEGKPIKWSGNVRMAREPYRELFQSFVHIVCNAADHGIETPDERVWIGKNRQGTLRIHSSYQDDMYTMSFADDGAGIDPNTIVEIARRRGIVVQDGLSPEEIFLLLCDPRFSSRSQVTELSGRGIGLEAVRRAAQAFGGDVRITSELSKGTKVTVWFKRQRYWY
jgi:two-component system chemotaxis sensor kinase CheA